MRKFLLGTMVACAALVTSATADDTKVSPAKSIDGVWTVVSYEKDGQPQADAKGMTVKAENGTLTCSAKDGKPAMTMKLTFGPNATLMATETTGETSTPTAAKKGVYVLTQDYLAICVHEEAKPTDANPKPEIKGKCTVILKRGDK